MYTIKKEARFQEQFRQNSKICGAADKSRAAWQPVERKIMERDSTSSRFAEALYVTASTPLRD
jgi:hypothetical protein